jgi:hypothetical protein
VSASPPGFTDPAAGVRLAAAVGPQQAMGLLGGRRQHGLGIAGRRHRRQAADHLVEEGGLRYQLAAQAPLPLLGRLQPAGVALDGVGRQGADEGDGGDTGHEDGDGVGEGRVGEGERDRRHRNRQRRQPSHLRDPSGRRDCAGPGIGGTNR